MKLLALTMATLVAAQEEAAADNTPTADNSGCGADTTLHLYTDAECLIDNLQDSTLTYTGANIPCTTTNGCFGGLDSVELDCGVAAMGDGF